MSDRSRAAVAFRPSTRRRNRLAGGLVLGALAIGGNVLVYASLDDRTPAVQVVRDVPAGDRLTRDMFRTVDVDVDGSVNVVPGDQVDSLVGRHAKVRLVAGSLVTVDALQLDPLVAPGNAVVAIQVADGALPLGLRERVPVRLVVPADRTAETPAVTSFDGRVVGLPRTSTNGLGSSVSVELAAADATLIAAADDVRVVLLDPSPDPAAAPVED